MIDWTHWHNEPYLVGGLVLLGWLYALAVGPLRPLLAPPATPYPRAAAFRFYTALVIFYLAVGSPLDQIGERFLLSAHMVQHLLLIYPAAILFLTGLPPWLADAALARPSLQRLGALLTHPIICVAVYTLVISLWHVPALYDWALRDKFVHVVEHVTFFTAALFYWWPIFSPSRVRPPLPPAAQMLYLIAVTITMTPLFAFIAFSSDVLYPTYEFAPRIIDSLGPAEDQLLGAAIMKLGGMLMTFFVFIRAFYLWYQDSEVRPTRAAI